MTQQTPDITTALTGDDLLTALYAVAPEHRYMALSAVCVRVLREAADLCGIDAEQLGKRAAIVAILANF